MGSSNICDIICHKRSSAHNLQGTVQDQGHSLIEEKMLLRVGVLLLWLVRTAQGNHVEDKFHYNATDWIQHIYGPADWNLVQCDDVATCVSGFGRCASEQNEASIPFSTCVTIPVVRSPDGLPTLKRSSHSYLTKVLTICAKIAANVAVACARITGRARSRSVAT